MKAFNFAHTILHLHAVVSLTCAPSTAERIGVLGKQQAVGELIHVHFLFLFYSFIYLWLCWVFVAMHGLSLVASSGAPV